MGEPARTALGARFARERERQNLTQTAVARMARVDQTTVSKAEAGSGSIDTYAAIARALDIALFPTDDPEPAATVE